MINDQPRLIADSFVVPDEAVDLVPRALRLVPVLARGVSFDVTHVPPRQVVENEVAG
jgi:hypothetical protein